jgi:hypothetical protein
MLGPTVLDELVSSTHRELEASHLAAVRVVAIVGIPVDADSLVDLCRGSIQGSMITSERSTTS